MFDLDFTVTPSKSASLPVIAFDTVDSLKASLLFGQPSSSLSQAWVTAGCKNHRRCACCLARRVSSLITKTMVADIAAWVKMRMICFI